MSTRKYLLGHKKRKKKRKTKEFIQSQIRAVDKFLGSNINNRKESSIKDLVDEEFENEKVQREDNMNREQESLVDHEQENLEDEENRNEQRTFAFRH